MISFFLLCVSVCVPFCIHSFRKGFLDDITREITRTPYFTLSTFCNRSAQNIVDDNWRLFNRHFNKCMKKVLLLYGYM